MFNVVPQEEKAREQYGTRQNARQAEKLAELEEQKFDPFFSLSPFFFFNGS
jgi:hypothetical protein